MMKIFVILVLSCTANILNTQAAAIDQQNISVEKFSKGIADIVKILSENLISGILEAIFRVPAQTVQLIEKKVVTPEFTEGLEEFKKIEKIIFDENRQIKGDQETKELVKKELDNIAKVTVDLILKALSEISKGTEGQVDGTNLKNAVSKLKQLVDERYSQNTV